jgi:phage tail-like protein
MMAEQNAGAGAGAGQTGSWTDPYRAYNFKLRIQGIDENVGHFAQCSGLSVKVQRILYREAGMNQVVHQLPGQVEHEPVILRYGLTKDRVLFDWFMTAVKGKVDRRSVSIVMLDPDGVTEALQWNLINAWLSEWRGAPLAALEREAAIESVTLVYETLERD